MVDLRADTDEFIRMAESAIHGSETTPASHDPEPEGAEIALGHVRSAVRHELKQFSEDFLKVELSELQRSILNGFREVVDKLHIAEKPKLQKQIVDGHHVQAMNSIDTSATVLPGTMPILKDKTQRSSNGVVLNVAVEQLGIPLAIVPDGTSTNGSSPRVRLSASEPSDVAVRTASMTGSERSRSTGDRSSVFFKKDRSHDADIQTQHKVSGHEVFSSTPANRIARNARLVVESAHFDIFSAVAVIANSLTIGARTHWTAVNAEGSAQPGAFTVIDYVFLVVFSGELACRIAAYGIHVYTMRDHWYWNMFDSLLVCLQFFEIVLEAVASESGATNDSATQNYSSLRLLRIFRLVRILRLVRIVRFIGELKTIISSVIGSLRALMWTLLLLMMFIYIVGIFFTQCVTDYARDSVALQHYYGGMGRAVLTLFQSFTGGVDWEQISQPLIDEVHPLMGLIFAFYIAFAVLAMLNVVTGVFVESALVSAKSDKDAELRDCLNSAFMQNEDHLAGDGDIEKEAFHEFLHHARMKPVLEAIGVEIEEAESLFELIDVDESGTVNRDEFIEGCLRLRGPAKAMDLAALMYDTKRHFHRSEYKAEEITDRLNKISEALQCFPRE